MGVDMEPGLPKEGRRRARKSTGPGNPMEGTSDSGSQGAGSQESGAAGEGYTFEGAFARLEEIVQQLEAGDAPLQDALALFEEGVRMARLCSQRLDEAETRIRVLMEGEDGSLQEVPWDGAGHGRPEGWEGID